MPMSTDVLYIRYEKHHFSLLKHFAYLFFIVNRRYDKCCNAACTCLNTGITTADKGDIILKK